MKARGIALHPVKAAGRRAIATSFWGKAWCDNLESYSDYASRLPRGRTYVRNGSVIDLKIGEGTVDAVVCGTETYNVSVRITPMADTQWADVCADCVGGFDSMVSLLGGTVGDDVLRIVADPDRGLFPKPRQIALSCSCPDWANLCKHVAAALYGVGARLDDRPELLFALRGVNPDDLLTTALTEPVGALQTDAPVFDGDLSALFGIALDDSVFDTAELAETPTNPSVVNDSPTFTEAERHVHRIIAEWTGLLPRHIAARTGRASTEVSTTLDALQAGGHIHKGADGLWRAKP
ncbi:MAG: putative Zn finger protein [Myxococcota bacterium]|jgi:uncharacterized Zn finger protein